MNGGSDVVDQLVRWERAGGTWRVLHRSADGAITLALITCHGEEMEQLTSAGDQVSEYVGARSSNEG